MAGDIAWLESRSEPEWRGSAAVWSGELNGACWLLQGRGAHEREAGRAGDPLPAGVATTWLHQVHSARMLESAAPGLVGEGDGLLVAQPGLAATIAAADCVPVLLATRARVAAVHAGWRGLAQGIVRSAACRLEGAAAWIGPAIGPCCYEVGDDVAAAVVAASDEGVRRPGTRGRPHLDLPLAAARQLAAAGVAEIRVLRLCTRCCAEWLESHRRDGVAAGRNLASIWLPAL